LCVTAFRLNVEWKYFTVWKWKADLSQNVREMDRMAVLHYDRWLVIRYLQVWRSRTQQRLNDMHAWVCIALSSRAAAGTRVPAKLPSQVPG